MEGGTPRQVGTKSKTRNSRWNAKESNNKNQHEPLWKQTREQFLARIAKQRSPGEGEQTPENVWWTEEGFVVRRTQIGRFDFLWNEGKREILTGKTRAS